MKNNFMIVVPSYEYNFCAKQIPITHMYLIAGKIETTKIDFEFIICFARIIDCKVTIIK